MQIVAILGSPRPDGNSAVLTRHFLATAQALGARCREYLLNALDFRGCQACMACKTGHETCVIDDGLAPVLAEVAAADLLVLASPVYYGDVSGQLKCFIDRTFCFLRPGYIALEQPSRLPAPKPLAFLLAQGHRDPEMFADILPRYVDLLRWTGFATTWPVRAVDVYHRGDAEKRPELLAEVAALAKRLVAGAPPGGPAPAD